MADEGNARTAALALLAGRAGTVCPSEVARAISDAGGNEGWRAAMPAVHVAVDRLVAEGLVRLSWKGVALPVREGPYRIGRVAFQTDGCPNAGPIKSQGLP